ncbi:MAG TPA: hypothetical protein VKF40_18460 [Burkholderiales bacterium]|nr:hypothetical protein [Burkholderiales bacterium]
MTGFYSYWTVLLSIASALFSSCAAMGHTPSITAMPGHPAQLWAVTRTFSMGAGIGFVHFLGMLSGKTALIGTVLTGLAIGAIHHSMAATGVLSPILSGASARMEPADMSLQQFAGIDVAEPVVHRPEVHPPHSPPAERATRVRNRSDKAAREQPGFGRPGQTVLEGHALQPARRHLEGRNSGYISDHKITPRPVMGFRG